MVSASRCLDTIELKATADCSHATRRAPIAVLVVPVVAVLAVGPVDVVVTAIGGGTRCVGAGRAASGATGLPISTDLSDSVPVVAVLAVGPVDVVVAAIGGGTGLIAAQRTARKVIAPLF
jgi:hypothetical protein